MTGLRQIDMAFATIRPLAFLILLAMVGSACSSVPKVTTTAERRISDNFPGHSAQAIQENVGQDLLNIRSFRSKTIVNIDSPQQKQTITAKMEHRASDSLTATITINLGIEVARSLATPDSFFVYDRIRKRLYHGSNEFALSQIPVSGEYDELFPNLTGLIAPEINDNWTVVADSVRYIITRPDKKLEWQVDPGFWRVTERTEYDEQGEVLERRSFSAYMDIDGIPIPRKIVLSRPQDETVVQFVHQSITLNPADLELSFEPGRINNTIEL